MPTPATPLPALPAVPRGALLAAAALTLAAALAARAADVRPSRSFRLTYSATVKDLPAGAQTVDLWLPYPSSDENQVIHRVKVTAPGPVTIAREQRAGNLFLHVRRPAAAGKVEVQMEIAATRWENAGRSEELSLEQARARGYLSPEPLVPLDGPVLAVARAAVRGKRTDAEKARAIYEHVTSMMKYDKSGTGWGRGDALFACDARRGNCTDFHALIIGAARSQGIPARFAMGVSLPPARGEGEIAGYHCWAELYVRGRGWVPVDSSEAAKDPSRRNYYYGHHDPDRLEFSRGRQVVLNPPQQGPPLNFFIYPYAEVDGRPHEGVERRLFYADVSAEGAARAVPAGE